MHATASPSFRGLYPATVQINRPLCREHFLLRLRLERGFPATAPGQFIQLGCRPLPGEDPAAILGAEYDWQPGQKLQPAQLELRQPLAFLRRPFSLAGRGEGGGDDVNAPWLEVVIRDVGVGTHFLAGLKPGETIDLIGPLGNAFTLPAGKKRGLLVGGGVGLPPMFYLAEKMHAAGWDAIGFVGAMTCDLLAVDWNPAGDVAQFANLGFASVITTNDGSRGLKGLITAGLESILQKQSPTDSAASVIYTCGPVRMMQAVAQLAATYRIDCQVCMEQAMACGMGTCQSCIVKITPGPGQEAQGSTPAGQAWRYQLTCKDGPVFAAQDVVW